MGEGVGRGRVISSWDLEIGMRLAPPDLQAELCPADINAMMQFIKERKELQQLEKLHISIN